MNDSYTCGLAALRFFCFSGPEQVASLPVPPNNTLPFFFPEQSEGDRGCEYLYGVACIFITYAGALYDKFLSTDESPQLTDFHQRLNSFMFRTSAEWSEAAVLSDENWGSLRKDAQKALNELGESLSKKPPVLNVDALIDAAEFRTSDETRRLLE